MTDFDSTDYQDALRELNDEFPGMSYDPSLSGLYLKSKKNISRRQSK